MSVSKNFQVTEWASVSQACLTKILGSEQGSFCGRIHHVTALFLCGTLRWRQSFDVCMASKGLLWQLVFSAAGVGHGLKRLGHGNRSNTEHFYRKPHNFRHEKFFNHLNTLIQQASQESAIYCASYKLEYWEAVADLRYNLCKRSRQVYK